MIGAIVGDIVGSRFEWNNIKTKDFELFTGDCFFTDDTVMTLAVGKGIAEVGALLFKKRPPSDYDYFGYDNFADFFSNKITKKMKEIGRNYPLCGYGGKFFRWMFSDDSEPYNSFGNGSAMRVSACGWYAFSMEEAVYLSRLVTETTHNHPEGIKGAEATAAAIYLAREGKSIAEIRDYIDANYYPMNFTLDEIRDEYEFDVTCQGTVPQAIMAFLESTSFEDAIRNAISIGGDSDTLAAITGSIAEAYYGVPAWIRERAMSYLDKLTHSILLDVEKDIDQRRRAELRRKH